MNHRFCDSVLKLHRIEYLVIDRNLIILETSAQISDFVKSPEAIAAGQDIRLGFPELVGYEPQLNAIFEYQLNQFTLRGIARSTAENYLLYIDLHVERDAHDSKNQLLILLEDVSRRMILEQQLVQRANETELLLQKLTEQNAALEKAKYAAEDANRAKSTFLAMMSHEIRTPMNGVIGTAELLLNSGLTSHQRQLVEIINTSGQALLSIINDILDFSKIEAGAIELESQPFNLRSCIRDAINLLVAQAAAKEVDLAFLDRPNLPNTIVGDSTRLRQILINLIGNAIKFTEVGEVIISATAHLQTDDRYEIEFTIRDTGIGIPSDRLNDLFQEFSQIDTSISRRYGGTGLGLAISKRLCEQMGGKMWVESQLDCGSTFHFTIATTAILAAIDRPVKRTIQPIQPQQLKILIAEDHPINQRLMLFMLSQLGYQADVANNGLEVLAALHRKTYDLILMDVQMPELDGIAATEQIDREWSASDRPRIIALTASAMEQDRQRCLQAGMSDYLTKPVQLDELARVLSQTQPHCVNQTIESAQLQQSKSDRWIDPKVLRQIQFATRHSATFVAEMIDLYFQKAPDLITTMRNSLDQGDCKTFKRAVHTLQGCSASIGAIQLTEQCRAIEEMVGKQGLHNLGDCIIEIETAYKNLQTALQQERQNYVSF